MRFTVIEIKTVMFQAVGAMTMSNAEVSPANVTDVTTNRGIVLYDGNCPLCQRSIRLLKRLDWLKKLHCQDCRDIENLPQSEVPLDQVQMLEQMHLVTPNRKQVYAG